MVFDGSSLSTARSSFGCAASIEICCAAELLELRQERIARRLRLHHLRIAEAQVHGGRAGDALERAVERRKAVGLGLLGPRLHPGLVELHDVGAGREQVLDLGVDRGRIVERQRRLVAVVVVLALLRHGERARHRHLDLAVGVGAQEFDVAHLDRMPALDRADHARHDGEAAGAVRCLAGIVEVDAVERGGEAVGIALAPLLAVGDDVEAGALLVADRDQRGVVLRTLEPFGIDAPQLLGAHPRRHLLGEARAVDQPVRLRIGADQRRGKQHQALPHTSSAVSTIIRNFAHCSSSARMLPSSVDAKPHCGDRQN